MNKRRIFALIISIMLIIFAQVVTFAMQNAKKYPVQTAESVTWVHEEPYFTDKGIRSKIPMVEKVPSYYVPSSLEDMENRAELIIRAEILPESQNVIVSKDFRNGHTRNKVKILEVLKGELKEGDEIFVSEPYFYMENENGEMCAYTFANYAPSQVGNEYIFFLTWFDPFMLNEYGYTVQYLEASRYLVKSDELSISSDGTKRTNTKLLTITEQNKARDGKSPVTKTIPLTIQALEEIPNEKLNTGNRPLKYSGYYDFYNDVANKYVDR